MQTQPPPGSTHIAPGPPQSPSQGGLGSDGAQSGVAGTVVVVVLVVVVVVVLATVVVLVDVVVALVVVVVVAPPPQTPHVPAAEVREMTLQPVPPAIDAALS